MIQFDEHIFQMGWFNHQLGMFLFFFWKVSKAGVFCWGVASSWGPMALFEMLKYMYLERVAMGID